MKEYDERRAQELQEGQHTRLSEQAEAALKAASTADSAKLYYDRVVQKFLATRSCGGRNLLRQIIKRAKARSESSSSASDTVRSSEMEEWRWAVICEIEEISKKQQVVQAGAQVPEA